MPLNVTTLQGEMEQFMVPDGAIDADPPLGWPDGVQTPPDPTVGTTPTAGVGNNTFAASGLTPGAFVDGYAFVGDKLLDGSPDPAGTVFFNGAKVTANTATLVTVDTAAANPAGQQQDDQVAASDDQVVYTLTGTPNVAQVLSVTRLDDNELIAVDDGNPSHDPANGVIAVFNPESPATPIKSGETLRFEFLLAFAGPVPAGVDFTIAPPKPAVTGLSTGDAWSKAYRVFIEGGQAMGVSPTPGSLSGAEAAMKQVIDGLMSAPGMGAVALGGGAIAFWGVVAANAGAIFAGSVGATPPPPVAGMSLAVAGVAPSVLALGTPPAPPAPFDPTVSQAAAGIIAGAINTASLGGLVLFQPGTNPVPFPFL